MSSNQIDINGSGLTYWTSYTATDKNPDYNKNAPITPGNNPTEPIVGSQKHDVSWGDIGNLFMNYLDYQSSNGNGDMFGISFHANIVDVGGGGVTVSAFAITHGSHRGFYVTYTTSIRLGEDEGASFSVFQGYYVGNNSSPDPSDFLGNSFDTSVSEGSGTYYWDSFQGTDFRNITWWGTGQSFGPEEGGSIGFGQTIGLYGFKK